MTVAVNSAISYGELNHERSKERVLRILSHGPNTDRNVSIAMGSLERNTAAPVITVLIRAGKLKKIGDVVCKHTGKQVRLVAIAEEKPKRKKTIKIDIEDYDPAQSAEIIKVASVMLGHANAKWAGKMSAEVITVNGEDRYVDKL